MRSPHRAKAERFPPRPAMSGGSSQHHEFEPRPRAERYLAGRTRFKHLAVEHKSFRQFEIDPESAAAAIILRILQPLRRAPTQQRKACRPKALRFRIDFEITQRGARIVPKGPDSRSEEHTSELKSLMRSSYAVIFLKKKKH